VQRIRFNKTFSVLKGLSKVIWFPIKETAKVLKEFITNKRPPDFYYKRNYPYRNNRFNYSKPQKKAEIKNKLYKNRNKYKNYEKTN
jgi:hypothetical protein